MTLLYFSFAHFLKKLLNFDCKFTEMKSISEKISSSFITLSSFVDIFNENHSLMKQNWNRIYTRVLLCLESSYMYA